MKNRLILLSLTLIVGVFIGWLFFHSENNEKKEENQEVITRKNKGTIWTCAMHPQIRMSEPGKCPICGMDLIPLKQDTVPVDSGAIRLSEEAVQLANVLTSRVSHQIPVKEVRLYGKVQADERLLQSQVAHIPGRIDKLLVNFKGESVARGEKLALIYSPEVITAQQELLEAVKTRQSQPEIWEAAREKLRQWKLSEAQINEIEKSGNIKSVIEIVSNTNGIITAIRVKNGDHVAEGTILYDVADLSRLWVMFDAYESDLEFLHDGDKLTFTLQALPGLKFNGKIIFIDPVIDPVTRVAKIRVEVNNDGGRLKPEMFATGIVSANLLQYRNSIVIPRSAVLWTGKRSIVYVKQPGTEPVFKLRAIELGPMLGDKYVVVSGLTDGEEIVTQGAFSVDAAAQLEGKPSMMNPEGGQVSGGDMEGMDMGDNNGATNNKPVLKDQKKMLVR
jgi:membrane fusion protein, copper/silver efflux system